MGKLRAHIAPEFTYKQRKEILKEIKAQLVGWDHEHAKEYVAMFLYATMKALNVGKIKLKRIYDEFMPLVDALIARYEMDDIDAPWLCNQKLLECGIDLEAWEKEWTEKLKKESEASNDGKSESSSAL